MEKKKLMRTKPVLTIEEQERAVEQLNAGTSKREVAVEVPHTETVKNSNTETLSTKNTGSLYSYNIKLDESIEKRVKAHVAQTGQNMKGFFQIAIREYLEKHGA
jgi:hypothetical protein